jgi:hypothetical protein
MAAGRHACRHVSRSSFMDNVSDRLLVLKGDGLVRLFDGTYTEVRRDVVACHTVQVPTLHQLLVCVQVLFEKCTHAAHRPA